MNEFDVIVIGGGTAGLAAARAASSRDARVALIESGRPGGKALFRQQLPRNVLDVNSGPDGRKISLEDFKREVEREAEICVRKIQDELKESGIDWIHGVGALDGGGRVHVQQNNGSLTVKANSVVIATGSLTRPVATLPFDEDSIFPVDRLWEWTALPESILIVHADPWGLEAAYACTRLGIKVFLVEAGQRLIGGQDPDLIAALEAGFKRQKIKVLAGKKIVSVFKSDRLIDVTLDGGVKFSIEQILVSGERLGNTAQLGLKALQIDTGKNQEVWVNEFMESCQRQVFAAGSVTGQSRCRERSEEEGRLAGLNAAGDRQSLDTDQIPFVLHFHPVIASIGCREADAHHKGYRAVEGRYDSTDKGDTNSLPVEFCRLVADRETRKIIGAQLCSESAAEEMSWIQSLMKKEKTVKSVAKGGDSSPASESPVFYAAQDCLQRFPVRR